MFKPSRCNLFEDQAPVDFNPRRPAPKGLPNVKQINTPKSK